MRVLDQHLARSLKGACFPCVALRARSPPGPVPLAACALAMPCFPSNALPLTSMLQLLGLWLVGACLGGPLLSGTQLLRSSALPSALCPWRMQD